MSTELTEAEREALWLAHTIKGPHFNRIVEAAGSIVADREAAAATKARADERERIAQAIEAAAQRLSGTQINPPGLLHAARIARGDA